MSDRYRVTSLDSIEALPGPGSLRWLPVRHELGIGAFGTNAYVARAAGDDVVEPHTEEGSGHEELYFVARGSATFKLDGAWLALRPAARAMIDAESGGKLLLIAQPPSDAPAEAARAGVENLARTLSIEWARYGIRTTAITPDATWSDDDVADVVAYLASPGGDYFSGARLGR